MHPIEPAAEVPTPEKAMPIRQLDQFVHRAMLADERRLLAKNTCQARMSACNVVSVHMLMIITP
jgi:hypothetical protein